MRNLIALLFSLMLAACGGGGASGGGAGGGSTPPTVPVGAVSGATFDGLIANGAVKVYDFSSGAKGAVLAQGTSDATGQYTLSLQIESRPLLIETTNGHYNEEAGVGLQVMPGANRPLTAVINYVTGSTIPVSVTTFSHLAAGLAAYNIGTGADVVAAINDANGRVSGWLGFDILATTPKAITDSANASAALNADLRYGFTAGAVSMWTHDHAAAGSTPHTTPYTSIDFAQLLYRDISVDGLLDGMGASGQLSFGTTPLGVDVYRRQLGVSMLKMANNTNNRTGLTGPNVLNFVQSYIASTDTMFANVTPVSIAAPAVTVSAPAINAVLMRTATATATATTNGEISMMELLIDNNVVSTIGTAAPTFSLDTTQFADGAHTLTVRATDTGGLSTTSTAVPVLVVNTAPAVSFLSPAANAVLSSVATVSVSPQSTVGIASVALLVDGVVAANATNLSTPAFSLDTRSYPDGAHALQVRVTDAGGQAATSSLSVVFANTAPGVTVSTPTANALIRGTVAVLGATTSGSGVALVELLVDNNVVGTAANVVAPTFSLDTTAFSDGLHTLKVRATDVGGLTTTATIAGVIFDNVAPAVSVSAPTSNQIVRGVVGVIGAATSAAGITSVDLLVDNNLVATKPSSASFTLDTGLYLDGVHTVTIRATDIGGLTSSASVPVLVNNVPPSLTLTAPAANAILQTTVSVTASASSLAGLKTVELLMDGQLINTAANLTSPTFSINTAGYADGAHIIAVRATDVGDLTTTKSVSVTIANVPPVLTFTGPAPNAVLSGASPITATAQSSSGLATVGLYVDNAFVAWAASPNAPNMSLATNAFADGPHVVELRATDVGGNLTSGSVAVVFDNIAPVVTVTSPGNNTWVRKSITVAGTVSDTAGLVSTELVVDGMVTATAANAAAPSFSINTTLISDGAHTVSIRATDVGGHVTTQNRTIKVDNTPPTSTATYSGQVGGMINLNGAALDNYAGVAGTTVLYSTDLHGPIGAPSTAVGTVAANGAWSHSPVTFYSSTACGGFICYGPNPTTYHYRIADIAGNCSDYSMTVDYNGNATALVLSAAATCP